MYNVDARLFIEKNNARLLYPICHPSSLNCQLHQIPTINSHCYELYFVFTLLPMNFAVKERQDMNYFELYEMPVTMKPDIQQVKQKFYELSRRYHPDFYTNASDEEQAETLEKSSLVNKAFKAFQNGDETIKYVLQLNGLLEEEEKYKLPPAFLMEMLELNEQIADAKMEDDTAALQQIQSTIHDIQSNLYEPVQQIVEHYQEGVTTKEELLQVKDYYYKKKYLTRILAGMQ